MAPTIKQFSINYVPVNEHNVFASGDVLQGQVVLEVSKETKINKLYIKCKGYAHVRWTEYNGNTREIYTSKERYFKIKQIFIHDSSNPAREDGVILVLGQIYNSLVAPGSHVFPFLFKLPEGNLPPSFQGAHGYIKYILEARLSRSWRMCRTAQKEFNLVPKYQKEFINKLKEPLAGVIEKKMKVFTSGSVSMHVVVDKTGYMPGEILKVAANIENSSSRDLNLKYKFEQKQTFTVKSKQKYATNVLFKMVEDPIPSGSRKTVTKELQIPQNLEPTILNSSIIQVEYSLKVYLDVPYAFDPEISLPLFVLSAEQYFPSWQNQQNFSSYGNTGEPGWQSFLTKN